MDHCEESDSVIHGLGRRSISHNPTPQNASLKVASSLPIEGKHRHSSGPSAENPFGPSDLLGQWRWNAKGLRWNG